MNFMGIDPGKRGGVAVVDADGRILACQAIPPLDEHFYHDIVTLDAKHGPLRAVLEHVHAMPVNGSIGNFKLGDSFGASRMALAAAGVTTKLVAPQRWQNIVSVPAEGKGKNRTKGRAIELFGQQITVTHQNADALLLAWCSRLMTRL